MHLHLKAQTHRSGTKAHSVQNIQGHWHLALPVLLAWFPASPLLPPSSHTKVLSTAGCLHLLFPLLSPRIGTALPSSPNSDFSLNATSSKRPSLPLQSEQELLYHGHLACLILSTKSFYWFNYLPLPFLERVPWDWDLVQFVQYLVRAQHSQTESINEHLLISVLVLGKEKPLTGFTFPLHHHIFMWHTVCFLASFIYNNE